MRIFSTGIGRSSPGRRKLKELALGAKEGLSGTLSKHWKYSYLRWCLVVDTGHCCLEGAPELSGWCQKATQVGNWGCLTSFSGKVYFHSLRNQQEEPVNSLLPYCFFFLRGTIRVWRQFKKENEVWVGKGKSYLWNYFTNLNLWTECWDFLTGPHLKSLDLGKIKCSISRLLTLRVGCSF